MQKIFQGISKIFYTENIYKYIIKSIFITINRSKKLNISLNNIKKYT